MKNHLKGALALAAIAPLAAQAEGKIYGQFNVSASDVDGSFTTQAADLANPGSGGGVAQDGQSADNNGSRLGFQGENGQFFYAVELGLGVDSSLEGDDANGLATTRHAFVGFNTSVGTLLFGRTNSAYKLAAQKLDPFYDTNAVNYKGVAQNEGGSYGLSRLANGWTDNTIAYVSPEVAGLTVNAAVYLQEQSDEDHDLALGVDYRLNDLNIGVQYVSVGADDFANGVISGSGDAVTGVETALQGTVSYEAKTWSAGLSYEMIDLQDGNSRDYAFLAGSFNVNENLKIAATYGMVDQGAGEGTGFTVGAFADLIKDFTFYGLYSSSSLDNAPAAETNVISLGVKYGFQI